MDKTFSDDNGSKKWNITFILLYLAGMFVMMMIAASTLEGFQNHPGLSTSQVTMRVLFGLLIPGYFFLVFLIQSALLLFEVKELTIGQKISAQRLLSGCVEFSREREIVATCSRTFNFSDRSSRKKIKALVLLWPKFLVITERMESFDELLPLLRQKRTNGVKS